MRTLWLVAWLVAWLAAAAAYPLQQAMKDIQHPAREEKAFQRLAQAVDSEETAWFLATLVGRRAVEKQRFLEARKYLDIAAKHAPDDCAKVQAASLLTGFPTSTQHAKEVLHTYTTRMQTLLETPLHVKGFDNDPYVLCVLTAFFHEIYYEADLAATMKLHHDVTLHAFPHFAYRAPDTTPHARTRLGIVSAQFYPFNSVLDDFQGVMTQLPKHFDVHFVYLAEQTPTYSPFLDSMPGQHLVFARDDPMWMQRARHDIQALELDVLLYLDATMSKMCRALAMSKLARVQAVTHGHPVTSGIPTLDYYISWAAAERHDAQTHYTEQLALLPAHTMHQVYEHRTQHGVSKKDGQPFKHLTRQDLLQKDGTWYTCMQKPFKRHPEFDTMLADILGHDPQARILLHDTEGNPEVTRIVKQRLEAQGVDLDRVHFIPTLPHHKLMALYTLSDVILDSYHAGGCTTTREALELGAPVVTLPATHLGGRWSLAYYNIMDVHELIAHNKTHYATLAVEIANNQTLKAHLQTRIQDNVHKLFGQQEAVQSWVTLLENIATHTEL